MKDLIEDTYHEGDIMALSNYPPGVTDSDIDAHFGDDAGPIEELWCSECEWPEDECKCSDEDEHHPWCKSMVGIMSTTCDCEDYEG